MTVKAEMDSKEGIEKVAPVDAQAVGLLDPSLLRSGVDDATTADPPPGNGRVAQLGHRPHRVKPLGGNHIACISGCCGTLMWSWNRIVRYQTTVGMPALAKIFAKPGLEYCRVPSPWICWAIQSFWCISCQRQDEGCLKQSWRSSRTSSQEVTCGPVFWLMCLSHCGLLNRREGIKQRPGSIDVGSRWNE